MKLKVSYYYFDNSNKIEGGLHFLALIVNQSRRNTTLNSKLWSCQWENHILIFSKNNCRNAYFTDIKVKEAVESHDRFHSERIGRLKIKNVSLCMCS